jgi:hypothetical protein
MLRSDLEVLEKQGRINLEELGLMSKVGQETQGGQTFLKAFKNISARFRWEARDQTETDQSMAFTADLT